MNLLGIAGLAARLAPGGESDLARYIPANFNIDATLRLLFSRDYGNFLSGTPGARDFRLTNAAALGALLDNNSQPLAFLETSAGFFKGGKIVDKDFPLPNSVPKDLPFLSVAFGRDTMAIPADTGSPPGTGPLYSWLNYDRIGTADDPGDRAADGSRFTTRDKEVTDMGELARSLSEHPLDFTEWYFPTKLVTDLYLADSSQISKYNVHKNGISARPIITLRGGSGIILTDDPANTGKLVVAPGYHHLDVLTAAPVQNDGRPDPVSANLAEFALDH
jgi:hypothetical protein